MKNLPGAACLAAVLLFSGCAIVDRGPADMAQMDQSRPRGREASLQADITLDVGALEISGADASTLYSLGVEYDKAGYQPDIDYEEGSDQGRLIFSLEGMHKRASHSGIETNRVRLGLTDEIPVKLDIRSGVGEARLALTRIRLTGLDLDAGVGGARISAYEPNPSNCDTIRLRNGVGGLEAVGLGNLNFRRFDFEGGVGGATLDFSGEWKQNADIRIQVGVGGVNVHMPRDIGVRVSAEKHFLSGFHLDGFRKAGGDEYYSDNYDTAGVRVFVVVKMGIGGFNISWL
jgi:hypothetical protein